MLCYVMLCYYYSLIGSPYGFTLVPKLVTLNGPEWRNGMVLWLGGYGDSVGIPAGFFVGMGWCEVLPSYLLLLLKSDW